MVTLLLSLLKPMLFCDTSLRIMKSAPLFCNFLSAFSSRLFVSAAKPITIGGRFSEKPTLFKMSGFFTSLIVNSSLFSFLILLEDTVLER